MAGLLDAASTATKAEMPARGCGASPPGGERRGAKVVAR
jgi:hypothetical protein